MVSSRESRTPLPQLSEDDVIDFCVREALVARFMKEQREAEKEREMKEWRKGKPGDGKLGL